MRFLELIIQFGLFIIKFAFVCIIPTMNVSFKRFYLV